MIADPWGNLGDTVVIIDTETTGLDADACGLIEVAAVAYGSYRAPLAIFEERIRLERDVVVDPAAVAVNGYDPVTWGGMSERAAMQSLVFFMEALPDHRKLVWCGVNIPFDMAFLEVAARRHGLWSALSSSFGHRTIDLTSLAAIVVAAGKSSGRSLNALRAAAKLPPRPVHAALQDCYDTRAVLDWMFANLTWSSS